MGDEKNRFKLLNEDEVIVVDTYTDAKYNINDIIKVLNDTEYFRVHHKKKVNELEDTVCMLVDVIDGFIALEKLRYDGVV